MIKTLLKFKVAFLHIVFLFYSNEVYNKPQIVLNFVKAPYFLHLRIPSIISMDIYFFNLLT